MKGQESLASESACLIQPDAFARYLISHKGLDEKYIYQIEPVVVLSLNASAFQETIRLADGQRLSNWIYPVDNLGTASVSRAVFTGKTRNGSRISLASTHSGGPASAVMLEMLILGGGRQFITIGTCAGLLPSLVPGEIFVPSSGLALDGTSRQYLGDAFGLSTSVLSVNPEVAVQKVASILRRRCVSFETGRTCTVDGFFGTTKDLVDRAVQLGCSVIEMELSALLAVAQKRRVNLMAILAVSDHFVGLDRRWTPHMFSEDVSTGLSVCAEIAIEIAEYCAGTDRSGMIND